jgi:hypothetical protein
MHGSNPGFCLTCSQSQFILYRTTNQLRGNKMTKSELEIIYETTSTLNKMCNSNHDFSKTIVEEMKTLVKIITTMELRLQKMEAK